MNKGGRWKTLAGALAVSQTMRQEGPITIFFVQNIRGPAGKNTNQTAITGTGKYYYNLFAPWNTK